MHASVATELLYRYRDGYQLCHLILRKTLSGSAHEMRIPAPSLDFDWSSNLQLQPPPRKPAPNKEPGGDAPEDRR